MADPQAATLTQLRNIQARSGKTIAELHAVLAASGLAKTGERRSLLMAQFQLGYGDANVVALFYGKPVPALDGSAAPAAPVPDAAGDPLDAIYTGAKAPLRALHAAVLQQVLGFGSFEQAPKKAYVSLRRKKQFAMIGPATKDAIEIGLNARNLAPGPRLKTMPAGGMCPYTLRISGAAEIDAELVAWLRAAYDAAA
ncbi:conserved hypothetical protein [Rubrivivax sp. A210]|uniref:DUF5655 domain-containing protein n=1 Tax=Rubrivivax sp. A210 TaxID=2772301 RepID=UPI001919D33C|nr:DUF5655 domain-containing protein [Rubrivivax sp. A210]CAD5369655.1 conserved hypothetical protein [Rubrivivax sp. A210]